MVAEYSTVSIGVTPLVSIRDATIWVNTVLHIAFECIAIYCRIAIFDTMSLKLVFSSKS